VLFQKAPMEGFQWGIVFLLGVVVFIIMEFEKSIRRGLKAQGMDTDDAEYGFMDIVPKLDEDISLPRGASHMTLTELKD
jgi:hypothetical protein